MFFDLTRFAQHVAGPQTVSIKLRPSEVGELLAEFADEDVDDLRLDGRDVRFDPHATLPLARQ